MRMVDKVNDGEAVDLSLRPKLGDHYIMAAPPSDGVDYCDLKLGKWIWSIGRRKADGMIIASLTGDLYQNPEFECLWLR